MATATIDASPLIQSLTLRVRGMRLVSLRLRVAALIFGLGSRVAGISLDMDVDSGARRELLAEEDRRIDRRAGCVYVSTHSEVAEDGTRWRTWDRIRLPD
jgi:hypothetical protein